MERTIRIRQFIVDNYLFGDAGKMADDDSSLMASGIIDSTGVLELIEFLEAEFAISVAEQETIPQNLDSVGNLARFVASKREQG
ncbi:acyl carrier protein [Gordonia phosphorivorans]|uniref:Acyl carrier protein n=1 Tax=Gordonia phosphorivorans TaxID=1056982 RepID=A0ABV6H500_9ACTN